MVSVEKSESTSDLSNVAVKDIHNRLQTLRISVFTLKCICDINKHNKANSSIINLIRPGFLSDCSKMSSVFLLILKGCNDTQDLLLEISVPHGDRGPLM